jgi:hypothetical protein
MSPGSIALLATAAWLAACGDAGLGGGDSCTSLLFGRVDDLSLELTTSERSASRNFMVVGEVGRAWARFYAGGTSIGVPDATFRSSDASVVRVTSETLTAVGAGSATILAEGCGLSDQVAVEVSAAPLPIDALRVNWVPGWPGTATNDPTGNLVLLALPVGESAPLVIQAIRHGEWVFGGALRPTLASSNTAVAEIMANCRPPEVDPDCGVYSDAWITGRGAGTVEMRVTVRNLTWSLQVQVSTP